MEVKMNLETYSLLLGGGGGGSGVNNKYKFRINNWIFSKKLFFKI